MSTSNTKTASSTATDVGKKEKRGPWDIDPRCPSHFSSDGGQPTIPEGAGHWTGSLDRLLSAERDQDKGKTRARSSVERQEGHPGYKLPDPKGRW